METTHDLVYNARNRVLVVRDENGNSMHVASVSCTMTEGAQPEMNLNIRLDSMEYARTHEAEVGAWMAARVREALAQAEGLGIPLATEAEGGAEA